MCVPKFALRFYLRGRALTPKKRLHRWLRYRDVIDTILPRNITARYYASFYPWSSIVRFLYMDRSQGWLSEFPAESGKQISDPSTLPASFSCLPMSASRINFLELPKIQMRRPESRESLRQNKIRESRGQIIVHSVVRELIFLFVRRRIDRYYTHCIFLCENKSFRRSGQINLDKTLNAIIPPRTHDLSAKRTESFILE